MFDLATIINSGPYSLRQEEKNTLYTTALSDLTSFHYNNSTPYKKILDILNYDPTRTSSVEDIPFIPVRLFKEHELLSVDKSDIVKTMTSSGTSGQKVSKIYLDRQTAKQQMEVLTKIMSNFFGKQRLPMLIIDSSSVVKDRKLFSARGAGILGFSMFGRNVTYALDDKMQLDYDVVENFCEKYKDEDVIIFGFTFMIWQHFYKELIKSRRTLNLSRGSFLHGGGWKKLLAESVDNTTFKKCLEQVCGSQKYHNYYGMVEQTGSIFMECQFGHLHCSIFSDIITRRTADFSVCSLGESGIIELVSLLPRSYPGHSLLSEDIGMVLGIDDCPCGRFGKYFKISGRIAKAETRGCSDTYDSRNTK